MHDHCSVLQPARQVGKNISDAEVQYVQYIVYWCVMQAQAVVESLGQNKDGTDLTKQA